MSKRRNLDDYTASIKKKLNETGDTSKTDDLVEDTKLIPAVSAAVEKIGDVTRSRFLISVNVDICRPWAFADRDESEVTDSSCLALIDDIRRNGQKVPAIARKVGDIFEIISGRRRLFACSRTNERKILLDVRPMNDKEAAHTMITENENRENISDIERAMSMHKQYKSGLWDSLDEMRIAYSEIDGKKYPQSSFSQILKAGRMADFKEVIDLFRPIAGLKLKSARDMVDFLEDPKNSQKTKHRVTKVHKRLEGERSLSASSIVKIILGDDLDNKEKVKKRSVSGFKNAIECKESANHFSIKIDKRALNKASKNEIVSELIELI